MTIHKNKSRQGAVESVLVGITNLFLFGLEDELLY